MLFISHDLGVVGEIADHVVVMRNGVMREQGPVARIFAAPQDAYTRALLACRPTLEATPRRACGGRRPHRRPRRAGAATAKPKDPEAPVIVEAKALTKSFWIRSGVFGARNSTRSRAPTFACAPATRWAWSASRAPARRPSA